MKRTIYLIASVILAWLLVGCETTEKVATSNKDAQQQEVMRAISGIVFYRERIALHPDAEVQITLEDVSLADAPSKVIAQQTFTSDGDQVPLDFELSYDANEIQPNHRYSVRAQIRLEGELIYTTDSSYPVITDVHSTDNVQLLLIKVR